MKQVNMYILLFNIFMIMYTQNHRHRHKLSLMLSINLSSLTKFCEVQYFDKIYRHHI